MLTARHLGRRFWLRQLKRVLPPSERTEASLHAGVGSTQLHMLTIHWRNFITRVFLPRLLQRFTSDFAATVGRRPKAASFSPCIFPAVFFHSSVEAEKNFTTQHSKEVKRRLSFVFMCCRGRTAVLQHPAVARSLAVVINWHGLSVDPPPSPPSFPHSLQRLGILSSKRGRRGRGRSQTERRGRSPRHVPLRAGGGEFS